MIWPLFYSGGCLTSEFLKQKMSKPDHRQGSRTHGRNKHSPFLEKTWQKTTQPSCDNSSPYQDPGRGMRVPKAPGCRKGSLSLHMKRAAIMMKMTKSVSGHLTPLLRPSKYFLFLQHYNLIRYSPRHTQIIHF